MPMGVFGSVTPVVSLGTMSKRWLVPGWRLGWIALSDPNGILKKSGVIHSFTYISPSQFSQILMISKQYRKPLSKDAMNI